MSEYWLASRYYIYSSATWISSSTYYFEGHRVATDGSVSANNLVIESVYFVFPFSLHPILTLKLEINYTLSLGTSADPFVLN